MSNVWLSLNRKFRSSGFSIVFPGTGVLNFFCMQRQFTGPSSEYVLRQFIVKDQLNILKDRLNLEESWVAKFFGVVNPSLQINFLPLFQDLYEKGWKNCSSTNFSKVGDSKKGQFNRNYQGLLYLLGLRGWLFHPPILRPVVLDLSSTWTNFSLRTFLWTEFTS